MKGDQFQSNFDRVHDKLDHIDNKLDDHLGRISRNEADVSWLKGHSRMATTFAVTLITSLIVAYFTYKG